MEIVRTLIKERGSWVAITISLLLFGYSQVAGSSADKTKMRADIDHNSVAIQELQKNTAQKEELKQFEEDIRYIRTRVDQLADKLDSKPR